MKNNMKNGRRKALKTLTLGGGGLSAVALTRLPGTWSKPVIQSVVLPAHAQTSEEQTSGCTGIDTLRVQSLQSDNDFPRIIALADSDGNTINSAGTTGDLEIVATMPPGTYRVFGDSESPQQHTIIVTTVGCLEETITVETSESLCTHLIATVELPSGVITPEDGEILPGEPGHCSP